MGRFPSGPPQHGHGLSVGGARLCSGADVAVHAGRGPRAGRTRLRPIRLHLGRRRYRQRRDHLWPGHDAHPRRGGEQLAGGPHPGHAAAGCLFGRAAHPVGIVGRRHRRAAGIGAAAAQSDGGDAIGPARRRPVAHPAGLLHRLERYPARPGIHGGFCPVQRSDGGYLGARRVGSMAA